MFCAACFKFHLQAQWRSCAAGRAHPAPRGYQTPKLSVRPEAGWHSLAESRGPGADTGTTFAWGCVGFRAESQAAGARWASAVLREPSRSPPPPLQDPLEEKSPGVSPTLSKLVVLFTGTAPASQIPGLLAQRHKGLAASVMGPSWFFVNGALNATKQSPCDPKQTRSRSVSLSLIVHGRSQRWRPVNINMWNNQGEPPRREEPPVPGEQWPKASEVLAERTGRARGQPAGEPRPNRSHRVSNGLVREKGKHGADILPHCKF